jgi:hypothetical protein
MTTPTASEPAALGPDLLWEVPLGLLSWAFFHLNKALIAVAYQRYLDRQAERGSTWRILSEETLRIPVSLPVLLTKGPRWNTHAAIGTLGPLAVRRTLAVETGQACRSAAAWSVVIYRYPDFATWREIGSLDEDADRDWTVLDLPPGRYSLGVRYYDLQPGAAMPAVRVDTPETVPADTVPADTVPAEPVPPGVNAMYADLAARTTPYHRVLHHYVHTMLRLRRWLPAGFVRREYLPVGDPCTDFRYDWFPARTQLRLHLAPRLAEDFRLYLSVYNRASLPVHSCELGAGEAVTPVFPAAGFYLIRLRPRRRQTPPCREEELTVERRRAAAPLRPA